MAPSRRQPTTRPHTRTTTTIKPHPSRGGNAYDVPFREATMAIYETAEEANTPLMELLRTTHKMPVKRTVNRWNVRIEETGSIAPYKRQGNVRATVLRRVDLVLLALIRYAYPSALADEVAAFLFNSYGRFLPVPRLYSRSQISKAEDLIGLSRKRHSTTARQAHLPRNIQKRIIFWTESNANGGIADIDADQMIDIDECGLSLETSARHYGKASLCRRSVEEGAYGHSVKHTLILAVAGKDGPNNRWMHYTEAAGTTVGMFSAFIQGIIDSIGVVGVNGVTKRCFTMDNLTAHHNPLILQQILLAGHCYAFRAPYYPVDGPIEYVFNTLENKLRIRAHEIHNHDDLSRIVLETINSIESFSLYFHNVGFH